MTKSLFQTQTKPITQTTQLPTPSTVASPFVNTSVPLESISIGLSILSGVIGAAIALILATWRTAEFKNSVALAKVKTDYKLTKLELSISELREDLKETREKTENDKARIRHIENHLTKTATGFIPRGTRGE